MLKYLGYLTFAGLAAGQTVSQRVQAYLETPKVASKQFEQ